MLVHGASLYVTDTYPSESCCAKSQAALGGFQFDQYWALSWEQDKEKDVTSYSFS